MWIFLADESKKRPENFLFSGLFCNTEASDQGLFAICSSCLYAVNEISTFTVYFGFNQAMAVSFKSRESLIEITYKAQVVNNRSIETFARDQ